MSFQEIWTDCLQIFSKNYRITTQRLVCIQLSGVEVLTAVNISIVVFCVVTRVVQQPSMEHCWMPGPVVLVHDSSWKIISSVHNGVKQWNEKLLWKQRPLDLYRVSLVTEYRSRCLEIPKYIIYICILYRYVFTCVPQINDFIRKIVYF
jgi:hypothetical protein